MNKQVASMKNCPFQVQRIIAAGLLRDKVVGQYRRILKKTNFRIASQSQRTVSTIDTHDPLKVARIKRGLFAVPADKQQFTGLIRSNRQRTIGLGQPMAERGINAAADIASH
jgi:hypothetical protein